jgi:hypothetical protein
MKFSTELLEGPPEILAKAISLEGFRGMATSYVHRKNNRATLKAVAGQVDWARRCGVAKDEIAYATQSVIAHPRAHPDRISELTRLLVDQL